MGQGTTLGNMIVGMGAVGLGIWAVEAQSNMVDESYMMLGGAFLILFGLYRAILAMVSIGG